MKIHASGSKQRIQHGRALIAAGKLGCLLLAGGQGTRLRFDGPKGLYPITPDKTLFDLFREERAAAGKDLPFAILVSEENEELTRSAVPEAEICVQENLPLLDESGQHFLEAPGVPAVGPNGNGSALKTFVQAGLWEQWRARGVEYLNIAMVDNPLGAPYDAEMVALLAESGADAVVKTTRRRNTQERVGVLTPEGVIEYSELDDPEGYEWANLGLFTFTMDFVQRAADAALPYHRAHKAVPMWNGSETVWPTQPNAWKREQFLFDVLPLADSWEAIAYPREHCFAPLKNATGEDSPATVRAAIAARPEFR